ncbi:hypothetical protein DM01DRAFT_1335484, partial [Hesseltinella vesiculosa]
MQDVHDNTTRQRVEEKLNAALSILMALQERQRESASLNTTSPSLAPHDSQTLQHDQWAFARERVQLHKETTGLTRASIPWA